MVNYRRSEADGTSSWAPQPGYRLSARRYLWLAAFLVVAAVGIVACSQNQQDNGRSAAFKLASIDSGNGYGPADDLHVARFQTLLDYLKSKDADQPIGEENIGSAVVAADEALKKRGISESLLNLMEGMNQLIRPGRKDHLDEYLAVYVVARSSLGLSHEKTIELMKRTGPKMIHMLANGTIRPDGNGGLIIQTNSGTYDLTPDALQELPGPTVAR